MDEISETTSTAQPIIKISTRPKKQPDRLKPSEITPLVPKNKSNNLKRKHHADDPNNHDAHNVTVKLQSKSGQNTGKEKSNNDINEFSTSSDGKKYQTAFLKQFENVITEKIDVVTTNKSALKDSSQDSQYIDNLSSIIRESQKQAADILTKSEASAKRAEDITKEFISFAKESHKNLMDQSDKHSELMLKNLMDQANKHNENMSKNLMDQANKHNENMSEAQQNLMELSRKNNENMSEAQKNLMELSKHLVEAQNKDKEMMATMIQNNNSQNIFHCVREVELSKNHSSSSQAKPKDFLEEMKDWMSKAEVIKGVGNLFK